MAGGVWQCTGEQVMLVAMGGPGVVNVVNVIANAEQCRVPLIVLTGCVDETEALTYTHQVLDHQQVLRPIAKASFRLTAEGADVIADKAVAIATESRAGPVHIDVPIAVARSEEHTSELQSLMRISYAVFCLKTKKHQNTKINQ